MRVSEFVESELVVVGMVVKDSRELIEKIAERICARHEDLSLPLVVQRLIERESKCSTGLECGIAIPHALLPDIQNPICAVATLAHPIDFGTLDGSPVRVVFTLLSPMNAIATHIRVLARITRLSFDPALLDRIVQIKDAKSLYRLLVAEDERRGGLD